MSTDFEPLAEQLLGLIASGEGLGRAKIEEAYLLSIAASMKRIADALTGDAENTGILRSMIDIGSALQDRRGH